MLSNFIVGLVASSDPYVIWDVGLLQEGVNILRSNMGVAFGLALFGSLGITGVYAAAKWLSNVFR